MARVPVTGTSGTAGSSVWTLPGLSVQQYVANLRWRACPSPCGIDLSHRPNKNGTGNEPDAVSVDSARCNAMPPDCTNVCSVLSVFHADGGGMIPGQCWWCQSSTAAVARLIGIRVTNIQRLVSRVAFAVAVIAKQQPGLFQRHSAADFSSHSLTLQRMPPFHPCVASLFHA